MVAFRAPVEPREHDVALAKTLVSSPWTAHVVLPSGRQIELPHTLLEILAQAIRIFAQNRAAAVVPYNKMLTTQEAADLLNVSHPYLVKLLESRAIPHTMAGAHRRIPLSDLMRYRKMRDSTRRRALASLTRQSSRLGMYR
jgi:excisionase family DNA binding protein